jgi:LysM repeat protein
MVVGIILIVLVLATLGTVLLWNPEPNEEQGLAGPPLIQDTLKTIPDLAPSPTTGGFVVTVESLPTGERQPGTDLSNDGTSQSPTQEFINHEIVAGDTLFGLAIEYGVSLEDIVAQNDLVDINSLMPGQILIIPVMTVSGTPLPTTSPIETNLSSTPGGEETNQVETTVNAGTGQASDWGPSIISGDLGANYPLEQTTASETIRVHYQPRTFADENVDWLVPAIDAIWNELETQVGGTVNQQVDLYLAGTLFGINPTLQGYTQSGYYRTFILVDGANDPGEVEYILAHELAHIISTYTMGPPYAPMIHEGLAQYLPQNYLTQNAGYLSNQEICALVSQTPSFKSAIELDDLAYSATGFGGHIRTFFNYNLSGCFVGFLIETYGLGQLNQVYDNGDYISIYGRTLAELDVEWQASLSNVPILIDPLQFSDLVEEIAQAYDAYVARSPNGTHANWDAYLRLSQARLAVNRGQLENARIELSAFHSLMGM